MVGSMTTEHSEAPRDEADQETARSCPNCGVAVGDPHVDGCDVARCTITGNQAIQCCGLDDIAGWVEAGEDISDGYTVYHAGSCGQQVWTGVWPGEAEAREAGWWCRMGPGGWIECDADHPDARPNLNRVAIEMRWNRETQRMELPANTERSEAS